MALLALGHFDRSTPPSCGQEFTLPELWEVLVLQNSPLYVFGANLLFCVFSLNLYLIYFCGHTFQLSDLWGPALVPLWSTSRSQTTFVGEILLAGALRPINHPSKNGRLRGNINIFIIFQHLGDWGRASRQLIAQLYDFFYCYLDFFGDLIEIQCSNCTSWKTKKSHFVFGL